MSIFVSSYPSETGFAEAFRYQDPWLRPDGKPLPSAGMRLAELGHAAGGVAYPAVSTSIKTVSETFEGLTTISKSN
jgi:hypothetical protein